METLPIVLISGKSMDDVAHIMSEIAEGAAGSDGEWRIRNKYYSARVRLLADPDDAAAPDGPLALAHVLLLRPDEAADEAARRAARAPGAHVRVLCCARTPAALLAWAARAHYEPVALAEEGAAPVRAALHAHPWPGRTDAARAEPPPSLEALAGAAAAVRALAGAERRAAAEALLLAALGPDADDL